MRPAAFRDPRCSEGPLPAALGKLEKWLADRQWDLTWSYREDDHIDYAERRVVINSRRTPQSQIFGILHEAGHILLCESPSYILRFPNVDEYRHRRERQNESLKVRIESLGEEWEAWFHGEELAKKLNLGIDYEAFRAARNRDLKTYARWISE